MLDAALGDDAAHVRGTIQGVGLVAFLAEVQAGRGAVQQAHAMRSSSFSQSSTIGALARNCCQVGLIFEHYDDLAPEWKRLLPMRRVWVVDREPEAS